MQGRQAHDLRQLAVVHLDTGRVFDGDTRRVRDRGNCQLCQVSEIERDAHGAVRREQSINSISKSVGEYLRRD